MSKDAKRYYAVLGVHPDASEEAIRGAFRRRAKELHPDAQSGNANAFILLKRAYDTLIDPEHRAAYDRASQPAPRRSPDEPRRPHSSRAAPPRPVFRPTPMHRVRGGVGIVRYAIAFLIMAAISIGGVEAMISLTASPPSIQARAVPEAPAPVGGPASADASTAPGSSKSGFWDPTPEKSGKKTP